MWKTASRNSDRLYTREEVLDFVAGDFETFSNAHKTSTPGFDNPPTDIFSGGSLDIDKAIYAAANFFGPVSTANGDVIQHDFYIGYWLTALGIAERLGFNDALRAHSTVAGDVLDWMIGLHRKRVVERLNNAPRVNPASGSSYDTHIWNESNMNAGGGSISNLPNSYTELIAQNGNSATWDVFDWSGSTNSRDGQATDQLIAAPSILKVLLGQTGSDLDAAEAVTAGWRSQKKAEQEALPSSQAGSTWFKYLQAAHNPVIS